MLAEPLKILLVEDNPSDVYLLREVLVDVGYPGFDLTHVDRLCDAIAQVRAGRFDVILLDLTLPDSYGLDTLIAFQPEQLSIPIIVLTGMADEELAAKAVRQGAQDYLVKGQVSGDLLSRAVRYAIERKRSLEELKKVNRGLKVLSEINQTLVRASEEAEFLKDICRIVIDVGGYRMAWVGYARQDEAKTVESMAQACAEDGCEISLKVTWADEPYGRGPTGTAIRTGKVCIAKDFLADPDLAVWREVSQSGGFRSAISLPLWVENNVIGALTIYAAVPDAFSKEEVSLLSELVEDLTYGIMALRTRADRKHAEERIRATNSLLVQFAQKNSRKEYLDSVVSLLQTWSRCQCVGIRLKNKYGQIPYASYIGFRRDFWEKENCLILGVDHCICTRIIQGKPEGADCRFLTPGGSFWCDDTSLLVEKMSGERCDARYRGECIKEGYSTVAVISIRYREETFGAIHLADPSAGKLSAQMVEFIESVSPLIGEAIHRFDVEESLQESNELLERVFSGLHLQIAYMDTDFNFIRVNRNYAMADGHSPEYYVGKNHFKLFPNAENEAIFRKVVQTGEMFFVFEKPFEYTKNPERGLTFWDWSLMPVQEPAG